MSVWASSVRVERANAVPCDIPRFPEEVPEELDNDMTLPGDRDVCVAVWYERSQTKRVTRPWSGLLPERKLSTRRVGRDSCSYAGVGPRASVLRPGADDPRVVAVPGDRDFGLWLSTAMRGACSQQRATGSNAP